MLTDSSIIWPYEFYCTIVNDNIIVPNKYTLKISIDPHIPVKDNIGLGFQRLRYFISEQLVNSVIINQNHQLLPMLTELESNLIVLPADPYDFYVGAILLNKFLSITEKFFDITQLTIDSTIGDHIQYSIWEPEECGLDLTGDYWWNWDNVSTNPNLIVTWKDLNLKEVAAFEPVIIKGGLSENR
jgi:hypothetical protein